MSQNTDVVLEDISYTRTDYTALRAHVLKIPITKIADLYYSEDSPQVEQGLERFLLKMRADLIERAIEHNPGFAEILKGARQGGSITDKALDILVRAADVPSAKPTLSQPVSQWLRPRTTAVLKEEGVATVGDLVKLVNRRGSGWWRGVPRIGAKRALAIVKWIQAHRATLGEVSTAIYTAVSPAPSLVLDPAHPDEMAPLGRFALPAELDGSAGVNRGLHFCFITATNDLQAIECYLARFEDQPHTLRAYRKELERFLLWSILIARKPMSSLLVDDCKAYVSFLASPAPGFMGDRAGRFTQRWKPFAKESMAPRSQRHAVVILRAAFEYLARVRYLGGNPWVAVKDPKVIKEVNAIDIEKALSVELWTDVIEVLAERSSVPEQVQDRISLAAVLLLGDSGLRREEVAGAKRAALEPSRWGTGVWTLRILGKGDAKRDVPVSSRTVAALRAHWADLGRDFDAANAGADDWPLLMPVTVPQHAAAVARHEEGQINGYTADGLYRIVMAALVRVRKDLLERIDPEDDHARMAIAKLSDTTPHSFRHTFGTLAVEQGMPQDVVQLILGHASGTTTSIYVRAKEKRVAEEASKYFGRGKENDTD